MTVTWNPSDAGSGITFTNTNHTASTGSSFLGNVGVRGTTSHSTGQWYFEVTGLSFGGQAQGLIGWADATQSITSNVLSAAHGIGVGGSLTDGGPAMPSAPDAGGITTVCFAINLDTHLFWIRYDGGNWNNSGTANPATGVGGANMGLVKALFPFFFLHNANVTATINCGDTTFNQTPPSGYSAWQGTQSHDLHITSTSGNQSNTTNTCTVGYTTTEANQVIVLAVNSEPNSTSSNKTVSTVTDTHGLTWTRRTIYSPTLTTGRTSIQNVELWWAVSPTAQSGTITVTMTASTDNITCGTISVAGVQNLTNPWDSGGNMPAQAGNTGGSSTQPATSVTQGSSGAVMTIMAVGWPHSGSISGVADASKDILLQSNSNGAGVNWCYLGLAASVRTTTLSSQSIGFGGTIDAWALVVDAITSAAGTTSGTWASTEAKDTFAATGSPNLAGTLNTTDTKDAFSGAGTVPDTGTLSATDTPDAFTGAGLGPVAGPLSVTEHGDSWATSGGWDPLGIDTQQTNGTNGGDSVTVSTNGPDRIVVVVFASVGTTSEGWSLISSVDGPLTWQQIDEGVAALPGAFGDNISLQIMWAYAHDKLTNHTFHFTTTGGALLHMSTWFTVKGLNGNFNNPWAPLGPEWGPSVGGDGPNDVDSAKTPTINPFGTGPVSAAQSATYYPSVLLAVGMDHAVGLADPIVLTPPFNQTNVTTGKVVGSQRVGRIDVGLAVTQESLPWQNNDSSNRSIQWGEQHQGFLVIAETLAGISSPNRWISQEGADTMSGHGYSGSSPGPIGQLTATDTPDHFQALGFQPVSGTWRSTEAQDKFSAFIKITIRGTLAATEATDKMTAHGIGLGEDGTWTSTESVDKVNMVGYTPASGPFNTTETTDKARFIGAGVISTHKRRTFYVT